MLVRPPAGRERACFPDVTRLPGFAVVAHPLRKRGSFSLHYVQRTAIVLHLFGQHGKKRELASRHVLLYIRDMSQQHQQLPGAIVALALSIATLAAVLAGMERGRSRRHARDRQARSDATFPADRPAVSNESCLPTTPTLHAAGAAPAPTTLPSDAKIPRGRGDQEEGRVGVGGPPNAAAVSVGPGAPGQRLEILVHNISHKDMVLSLRRTRGAAKPLPQRPAEKAISNAIVAVSCVVALPIRIPYLCLAALQQICTYAPYSIRPTHEQCCRSLRCG